jgi:hypothetical protein
VDAGSGRFHCVAPAVDEVFARMMEMELFQRIRAVADVEPVAFHET